MKRLGYIVAFVVSLIFASCEGMEQGQIGGEEKFLTVNAEPMMTLEAGADGFKLQVESNTTWTIASSAEWLTILGPTEVQNSGDVMFSYTANTTGKSRGAKIDIAPKVAGETASHTIMVSQKAASGNTGGSGSGDNTGGDDNTGGGNTGGDDTGGDDNTGGGGLVTDGGTPHAGWAELPAEEDNSDYYYAYHMRADKGTQRNFSVCYSAEMGCPVWVAAPIHKCYCGSGRNEKYAPDPVIPSSVQKNADKAGDTNQGNWMNRGHMLASNMRNVTATTNQQVFYYSNIAPQDGDGFNTGGGWWNDLEDLEKNQYMCSDTLYTVNGCHWANKNETFGNRVVPTHFYKVFLRTKKGSSGKWVVNCSESELQCVAFYAPHYHGSGGKTAPTRSHMMSVAELERITGHTFFPNVPNAPKDTFNPSDWGM